MIRILPTVDGGKITLQSIDIQKYDNMAIHAGRAGGHEHEPLYIAIDREGDSPKSCIILLRPDGMLSLVRVCISALCSLYGEV